jgi:RsiW-degrading membrane proteinase PrsW (M82 family)
LLNVLLALLPVLAFLLVLVFLDSFKLVSPRSVTQAILVGAACALVGLRLNGWLLDALDVSPLAFSRYVAPLTEEVLKAVYVAWLLRRGRVGFVVDGAILGFAVGAGFALVENVEYLWSLVDARVWLWVVRGFGTAVLHGATTAILATLTKVLSDRHPERPFTTLLPGLLAALLIHSLFNHFPLPPLAVTGILLLALPPLLVFVFERSEEATRDWLGVGLDDEVDLLRSILTGEVAEGRVGSYLRSLKARFPGTVVADMLCLLRIQLELSIRAKGMLLAREAGFDLPAEGDVRARLEELRYLERSVGPVGLLAAKPILRRTSRDLWQLYVLEQAGARGARRAGARA